MRNVSLSILCVCLFWIAPASAQLFGGLNLTQVETEAGSLLLQVLEDPTVNAIETNALGLVSDSITGLTNVITTAQGELGLTQYGLSPNSLTDPVLVDILVDGAYTGVYQVSGVIGFDPTSWPTLNTFITGGYNTQINNAINQTVAITSEASSAAFTALTTTFRDAVSGLSALGM